MHWRYTYEPVNQLAKESIFVDPDHPMTTRLKTGCLMLWDMTLRLKSTDHFRHASRLLTCNKVVAFDVNSYLSGSPRENAEVNNDYLVFTYLNMMLTSWRVVDNTQIGREILDDR
ncbi:3317_t:CDS:2 [Diversispora eburnea]|uniref:3317_t:CDS:1 n=1 Tax=Diversispora eburnea TaxID=1213867 RepID=A0A9N8Z205_9GLOM|nr:3317_t:CDS:2 [Diversispora eburnea]